jgi:hypothetical protein
VTESLDKSRYPYRELSGELPLDYARIEALVVSVVVSAMKVACDK